MQRRQFLSLIALLPAFALARPALAAETFDEGIDYLRLAKPLPVARKGRTEVLELFWYGCPHCHQLEPLLEAWHKRHRNVAFNRLPAILGDSWAIHARAYYAAESLGVLGRFHQPLFDAIHVAGKRLNDEAALVAFAASQGIDAGRFRQAMGAFAVDARVRQALETTRRVGLDGVPALVVNGRFLTSPTLAGNRERTLAVLDFLVAKT
ncbi:MAG: thiol:disulfide interchange protein DsbA/DsbL [Pseudomonadota bacterium]|nr:thiol:disulfide interchange protein DsbA/DsbL [Pseudomonadota bacterium]MDP2352623.1 thiol:disulfide interchange protein DsbA/DsbL [Pseudomonadota bacterium]